MIIIPSNPAGKGEPSAVIATISGVGTNPGGAGGMAIIDYNGYIYVGSQGEIAVIDPASNSVVSKFVAGNGSFLPGKFVVHPTTNQLYVGGTYDYGGAGAVYQVNGTSSTTLKVTAGGPGSAAFNADGTTLLAMSNQSYYYTAITTSNWSSYGVQGYVNSPLNVIHANNKFFVVGTPREPASNYYGGLVVLDNNTNYLASVINAVTPPYWIANYGLCSSNDKSKVYFTDSRGDSLRTVNTTTNALSSIKQFGYGNESYQGPTAVAVSVPGSEWNRIYVLHTDGTVKALDGSTQEVVKTISGINANARGICVSAVSKCVYVVNYNSNTVSVIG